ncbi:MAG: Spy/CpxP family protein refolding chaperone [Gemmatimonadaceae bacterium]|nr:Spy/CpxP family protein refolding chaperone [Gemmatimonadaceae bacterium]
MNALKWVAIAGAFGVASACSHSPTGPATLESMQPSLDAVDPVAITFQATHGLPGGPYGARGGSPFMGGMAFGGSPMDGGRGPAAQLPEGIRLTDAQSAQIQALVTAFLAANASDIAALAAAHSAARDAVRAGATRDSVRSILDAARSAADRLRAAADALHTAIWAVLSDAQRTWIGSHKPDRPLRMP